MVKVSIIGATGYVGAELIRILSSHPKTKIIALFAQIEQSQSIDTIFPQFKNIINLPCEKFEIVKINNIIKKCDVVFLAIPHTVSMKIVSQLINKVKIIDLSADYRFKNVTVYEKWYKVSHIDKNSLEKAVYGLPEIYKKEIKNTPLVSIPGCYPTSIILALLPLLKKDIIKENRIIIDAKTGISGAGRIAQNTTIFSECNENLKAYNIGIHRHTPEINEILSFFTKKNINVLFAPHLIPINRGILSTIYCELKKKTTEEEVNIIYANFYKNAPFVKILKDGVLPEIKMVRNSNYCYLGIKIIKKSNILVVVSCIDNLIKGAAGQAIQCMNIIFNFDETLGLKSCPIMV